MSQGTKRTRTEQPDNTQIHALATGHDELLIACPELQTRLSQKYCDETGLLPLLLAHGIVRRVRTIEVTVQPLGGDNFTIKLNAAEPSVGEAKAQIARTQGTLEDQQELYKVAVRADGCAVREDDAEPEALDDDAIELGAGEMVTMAVKEAPLVWRTCDEDIVELSEGGAVATNIYEHEHKITLMTSGVALSAGKHYWEVEFLDDGDQVGVFVGVTRPNLDPNGTDGWSELDHSWRTAARTDVWYVSTTGGGLCGNGKGDEDQAGSIDVGARVGVLLDLEEGSLRFFMNDVQHGPGYPAGSVNGPVVCAVHSCGYGTSVRLLPQAIDHPLLQ
jgi:hypothetical protein